jgi:hypothetical protein
MFHFFGLGEKSLKTSLTLPRICAQAAETKNNTAFPILNLTDPLIKGFFSMSTRDRCYDFKIISQKIGK